jgi:hypothetical protein
MSYILPLKSVPGPQGEPGPAGTYEPVVQQISAASGVITVDYSAQVLWLNMVADTSFAICCCKFRPT